MNKFQMLQQREFELKQAQQREAVMLIRNLINDVSKDVDQEDKKKFSEVIDKSLAGEYPIKNFVEDMLKSTRYKVFINEYNQYDVGYEGWDGEEWRMVSPSLYKIPVFLSEFKVRSGTQPISFLSNFDECFNMMRSTSFKLQQKAQQKAQKQQQKQQK
jgi:hypothetical protein